MNSNTMLMIASVIAVIILLWPQHVSAQAALTSFGPDNLYREMSVGYNPYASSALFTTANGGIQGLRLNKFSIAGQLNEYYNLTKIVPASITFTTGLTFKYILVDTGTDSGDLGLVVRVEVTPFNISASGGKVDWSVSGTKGTATASNATLNATSGVPVIGSIAIANAALASLAAGNIFGMRIRRVGDNAADTCNGDVILVGGLVFDT